MNKYLLIALLLMAMLLVSRTMAQEDTGSVDDTGAQDNSTTDDQGGFSNWVNETDWLCGSEACSCNDYYANALLIGANEVPPVLNLTDAWGSAIVRLIQAEANASDNSTTGSWILQFSVFVQGVHNISVAHIHVGKACEVGDPILTLYPFGDAQASGAPFAGDGLLVSGSVSDAEWAAENDGTLLDMWDQVQRGTLYVNVHNNEYPEGAIRGQLLPAKK